MQDLRGQTMGGHDKRSQVNSVALHHSATDGGNVFKFENYWKSKGWNTGGYHEVVLRNGDVQLCYDADVVTNGVYGHNQTTYHICYVGNGDPTDAQLKTLHDRIHKALDRHDLGVNDVLGHKEFSGASTACPGIDMDDFRADLKGNDSDDSSSSKSIDEMADEVLNGEHGNGHENRRQSLGISHRKYERVRAKVNQKAGSSSKPKKSIDEMAQEVINGEHGNRHANRRQSLGISDDEYEKVKDEVNRRLGGSSKSISEMAQEVINGEHGNGHDNRRQSLGIGQSKYEEVRREVNRRL